MQTKYLRKGFPLLTYFSGLRKNDRAVSSEIRMSLKSGKEVRSILYSPAGKNPKDLPGVYLLHGMSVLGIDDIRIQNLARNIALCGFSVFTPELKEVKSLLIQEATIQNIIEIFKEYRENPEFHNRERIGFFSASFCGSMGLVAFAQPEVNSEINSAMAIGSYCDFTDGCTFALEHFQIDNYAALILFHNFLEYLDRSLHKAVASTIYHYAVDNAFLRTGPDSEGDKSLAALKPAHRDFVSRMMTSEDFRKTIIDGFRESVPKRLVRTLSPYYHLGNIKAPVSLLHGESDPVIPARESYKMYMHFVKRNHPANLEISPLIGHGDPVPLHSQIAKLPGVTKSFGFYFSHI
jgi:predicted alpha/beta-fold hydrolase